MDESIVNDILNKAHSQFATYDQMLQEVNQKIESGLKSIREGVNLKLQDLKNSLTGNTIVLEDIAKQDIAKQNFAEQSAAKPIVTDDQEEQERNDPPLDAEAAVLEIIRAHEGENQDTDDQIGMAESSITTDAADEDIDETDHDKLGNEKK